MQKQYLALGERSVFNGQYMLAAFKITRYGDISLADAATEVAAESSTGSNLKVGTATPFSMSMDALVYELDEENDIAYLAYPWRIFDRGGNVQNILTFIAGNVFGMSNLSGCKLLDIYFPPQMLTKYDGPSTTVDDMRKYLNAYDRPVLGTIIKPKIGLTATEYAELCHDFWIGGGDFVKNDEPQADQDFAPFTQMVESVRSAMDMAEDKTGHTKVHSFNVSSPDFETMIKRADYIQKVMNPGSYAFLIDGITAGWMAVQTLRRKYPDVFIHFHRAGHGAFTRKENPIGYTVAVLTKFARLAGASGIHTGTAGVGKMDGRTTEDIEAMHQALRLEAKGSYFKQVWSRISEQDQDIQAMIKAERSFNELSTRDQSLMRKEANGVDVNSLNLDNDWRVINKTVPIVSGGMNPVLLPQFLDVAGSIDFIITMGGGIHSHPMETTAGTKAVVEAFNAWQTGQTLDDAAHDGKGFDEELDVAIKFYNEHGTQAHRVHQNENNKVQEMNEQQLAEKIEQKQPNVIPSFDQQQEQAVRLPETNVPTFDTMMGVTQPVAPEERVDLTTPNASTLAADLGFDQSSVSAFNPSSDQTGQL